MRLYSSSVKRPVTTILIFVALIVLGLFSLRSLPIDLFPDVETNTIMVMTSYAGTSASDIEQLCGNQRIGYRAERDPPA